jgi:tetraacyldisaccharide 4'-kinase
VVIALAELLRERGWDVDVLSRGYGRCGRGVDRVASAEDSAARFGDEPVLIAQRTGVPVWVGGDRFAAGRAAEGMASGQEADFFAPLRNDKGRGVHLLDDGFQHRGLARAVDVVLVTVEDLDDALLPAGNLREGLGALRRADVVVVREEERERVLPRIAGFLRAGVAIWTVRRTVDFAEVAGGRDPGEGFVAFCAIARPGDFVAMLRGEGLRVVDSVAFPDHHRYTGDDVRRLVGSLRGSGVNAFVTTEKDAVKIGAELRAQFEVAAPLLVARLQVGFADADGVVRELEGRIS